MAETNEIVARGELLLAEERKRVVLEHLMAQQAFDDAVAKKVEEAMRSVMTIKFDELVAKVDELCMCVMSLERAVEAPKVRVPVRDALGQITSVVETTMQPEGPEVY